MALHNFLKNEQFFLGILEIANASGVSARSWHRATNEGSAQVEECMVSLVMKYSDVDNSSTFPTANGKVSLHVFQSNIVFLLQGLSNKLTYLFLRRIFDQLFACDVIYN